MDRNARQRWLIGTIKQMEQYQKTTTPQVYFSQDEMMEEQEHHTEQHDAHTSRQREISPSGSEQQPPYKRIKSRPGIGSRNRDGAANKRHTSQIQYAGAANNTLYGTRRTIGNKYRCNAPEKQIHTSQRVRPYFKRTKH